MAENEYVTDNQLRDELNITLQEAQDLMNRMADYYKNYSFKNREDYLGWARHFHKITNEKK